MSAQHMKTPSKMCLTWYGSVIYRDKIPIAICVSDGSNDYDAGIEAYNMVHYVNAYDELVEALETIEAQSYDAKAREVAEQALAKLLED